ncbi:MAG TPA: amidase [Pyrinomonadaceae bacterium]|jgi:Asp-tRNA(Asn)/Glu-tRNA(Gln) amidotransferase A subunit family amidase
MSAVRLVALMRAREASPVEVMEAHLRRAERVNPRLNAVVTFAPDALERAREAERSVMRGDELPPLHGLPVTVKDTIDTAGLRTTNGSRARADRVPRSDAPSVARLRAAGAIVIGKTNTSEFALDYTAENPVFGRTLNPHDESRTPGGSSGGCAAAVASCLTPAGLGSDLAGSVRIPAHFCGVAGLRPTAGLVPGAGHAPPVSGLHSLGASLGPLARHVSDLHLLFNVLAGHRDAPASSATTSREEAARGLRRLRVAWYADDGTVAVTDEIAAAVRAAVGALRSAGAEAVDEVPPGVGKATDLWLSLFEYATQRFIRSVYEGREQDAGRAARVIIERARKWGAPTLEQLLSAWDERERERAELLGWMERTPLLVAPVGAVPAFGHDEYGRVGIGGESVPTFRALGYAHAANVFDLPAACVPAGRTAAGLPVGVQIVGRPHDETLVLAAAGAVEAALGGWQRPAGLF